MNLRGVADRIRKGDLQYVLGRFKTIRIAYGGARRLMDRPVGGGANANAPTLFSGVDVNRIIKTIRQDAVFVGLKLPAETVEEIAAFGRAEPLFAGYDPTGPK